MDALTEVLHSERAAADSVSRLIAVLLIPRSQGQLVDEVHRNSPVRTNRRSELALILDTAIKAISVYM